MNGEMCDVWKSSPKVLFFVKNVLQEYALIIFANLVMSRAWHCPLFFAVGMAGENQKQHEDCIFAD